MTMGQRIRAARMEAGLSQRQLAGEEITRNMLSALEHDGANPSVATLKYLSRKLCKPISYFLGEDIPKIPEAEEMALARQAYQAGEYRRCLELLEGLEREEFRQERQLLDAMASMVLARQAIRENRLPYANELLSRCDPSKKESLYFGKALRREWRILAARAAQRPAERAAIVGRISGMDEVLELKARVALEDGDTERAERLLDAMDDRGSWEWNRLRGEAHLARKEYEKAARCFHRAEQEINVDSRLEICYREMGDFKMAYYYARKG